jgi:hypothetical protein
MASIISFIKAWRTTADLVQRFVEAWLSYQIKEVQESHDKKQAARNAIIKSIEKARKERTSEDLISLTYSLAIVERGKL